MYKRGRCVKGDGSFFDTLSIWKVCQKEPSPLTHRPRLHSLCEFLYGCSAFVSQDHLALEGAFLKNVAFLAQVGCDGSQLHGLDALGGDELVGGVAGGGDIAQELNVHWGQAFISHGF